MAVARHHTFVRDEILPSWWANAVQVPLSALTENFHVRRLSNTTVRVAAGAGEDIAALAIDGRWRWIEANVDAVHPGGGAGLYRVWATAVENDIRNAPLPNSDFTDYAFALTIRSDGAGAPPVVAGVVDIFVEVANLDWSGTQITGLRQTRESISGPQLEDAALGAATPLTWTRQADGALLLAAPVDGAAGTASLRTLGTGAAQAAAGNDTRFPAGVDIVNADIAAAAAIARSKLDFGAGLVNADIAAAAAIVESKLSLATDAVAGTGSRRTLGTGAQQAAAGNDVRFPAGADIVNADIDAAAAIAESKLSLATDAVAGTGSRRTLGTGAQQAAAGNDTRFPAGADIATADIGALAVTPAKIDPTAFAPWLLLVEVNLVWNVNGITETILGSDRNVYVSGAVASARGSFWIDQADYNVASKNTYFRAETLMLIGGTSWPFGITSRLRAVGTQVMGAGQESGAGIGAQLATWGGAVVLTANTPYRDQTGQFQLVSALQYAFTLTNNSGPTTTQTATTRMRLYVRNNT